MLLTRSEIESLTGRYNRWHVSIYLPTERVGADIQQNSIRLDNLLRESEEQLLAAGAEESEVERLLAPARQLVEDQVFWQQQSAGLAVFLADGLSRYYQLPLNFEEQVVVSGHFHIKPLLPVISSNGQFFLLSLDQQEIHLYQGSRYTMSEIQLEVIPDGLAEILKWDDPERRLQHHTGSGTELQGGVEAIFHGHGVASEDDPKDYIRRYFQRIDEGVREWLAGEEAPLVLAGVEYLLPLYQEANSYPHLLEEGIQQDPQTLDVGSLHARAWERVEPLFEESRREYLNAFHHLSDSEPERVSQDLTEIVPAAYFERIEALFTPVKTCCWGKFDPDSSSVDRHDQQQPADADLLDLAAAHTLINQGQVFTVEEEQIPAGKEAAAIFRY